MIISSEKCISCGGCIPYCSVKALFLNDRGVLTLNRDECVECGACVRSRVCSQAAMQLETDLPWPRVIRRVFSDPNYSKIDSPTAIGRGVTGEMKANDVNGRYRRQEAGVGLELGRPSTGVRFKEVEKVIKKLHKMDIELEKKGYLYSLLSDPTTCSFKKDILNEKALSVIISFKVPTFSLLQTLTELKKIEEELDLVFSVYLITRAEPDGSLPNIDLIKGYYNVGENCKVNVGLGKPKLPTQ